MIENMGEILKLIDLRCQSSSIIVFNVLAFLILFCYYFNSHFK